MTWRGKSFQMIEKHGQGAEKFDPEVTAEMFAMIDVNGDGSVTL